ncbi:MAG: hypothetical protein JW706_04815 [Opitutales bacterium]|nr:hypothetical protein [Opitutales bacterium]
MNPGTDTISIRETIIDGFKIGVKNLIPLIFAFILWIVTIWIPYINVGTTIALFVAIPALLSKGKMLSPLEIFSSRYRVHMGDFFLVTGFMLLIILPAYAFFIVPGIVMQITYMFALMLSFEHKLNSIQALDVSKIMTVGRRWAIFFSYFFAQLASYIVLIILAYIADILAVIWAIITMPLFLGITASLYRQLIPSEYRDHTAPEQPDVTKAG